MAELTHLQSKLGEVMGLVQAAQESTARVIKMVDDQEVTGLLRRMCQEAAETEKRCKAVARQSAAPIQERHVKDTRTGSLKLALERIRTRRNDHVVTVSS